MTIIRGLFISFLTVLLLGCATPKQTVYVERVVQVPVKISPELLQTPDVEPPPSAAQFIPFVPKTYEEQLDLLFIQRHLLVQHSQLLMLQVSLYKKQVEKIRQEQEKIVSIIEQKAKD